MSRPKPTSTPIPTGVVTFLFTDIVGSTEMWERHGDAFLPVLQAHNAILSDAIERNGGYLIKTEGDSYKAAFADPAAAVRCAIVAQAALQRYPWPADVGRVGVRMAVHSGRPFAQGGDYFGPPVNRTARILATAHGGQVIVSEDTLNLVENRMGADTRFADQGYHRLRDLDEPIRLYDVDHTVLEPRRFPPPKSLNGHAHNLPAQRTSFIGRQEQIEQIAAALASDGAPCLQITGPQGIGKTRLSLQVAAEKVDWFPDGVWFVRLSESAGVEDAALEVARTIGITIDPGRSPLDAVRTWLSARSCLLILDDCGHIPQAGRLIHELLSGSAQLRCLATAGEALQVEGATEFELSGLSLPPEQASAEDVVASEAGRLFVERAREARKDFSLSDRRAKPISRLLRALGGVPAGIEKAAEMMRAKDVTPSSIATALAQELRSLQSSESVAAARGAIGRLAETPAMASLLSGLGSALADSHSLAEAERASQDALAIYDRIGDRRGVAAAIRQLGKIAFAREKHERAAALLQAAAEAFRELDGRIAEACEAELALVRRAMGADALITPLTLTQAVQLATGSET